ncbi:hypothetical protein DFJ74DRAFT_661342 [Hyaloraphidium curvatum]|nr:hypothetical protein DFJ74DRAFT_661342 [Hyaloraphidium curvatum]
MSQAHVRINVRRPAAQVPPGGITGQLGNPGIEVTPCAEADAERLGQVEVEIAGLGDRVEIARVKVLVMLDEMTGLRSLNLNLEPSHPNMFHNVIAGPRRRTLRAVMRRTRTNIYFPSPFVVQSVEMAAEAAGMVITGVGASVDEAVRVLRELADQKKPQIVSHTLTFPTHKLDWMLANRRDVLTRTMWDNGTFVLFPVAGQGTPQGAPSCRLVTVLGDDRVYVERTIRMLTLLACECYVACIDLSHPVHSIPAAADAAAGFNGWPASPAAAQAPFQELDWKALLENVAQTTRAVVVLRDQGRAIEVLGVEATAKSAHATLAEHPSLRPYVSRAHFRIGLAQEHRDFVRGKKDGKIARIIKGSGGCNVRVEDDRNGRTVTVVVEHHDPGRVLEGVALAEEELPAELAFHLPERYHKQAIGVGGRRIQAIMRRREAYVKFASSEEVSRTGGFDVGEVGDNVIVRTPARNARNLELVRRDVEAAVGWAEGGNGDGSVAITMRIPRRFHRRVAARGGVFGSGYPGAEGDQDAVHEIEERTGTRIRLPDRELGVDEVAIEGPQRGVEAAAKVLQALVPGLVQMALPAQAAAAVGSAEFAGYADRALREYETEVRTYVPGAAQDKDAGSPDGQAGGKSEVGRDEPIDLLVEADDPQFADEIAWHSIAPFLSSQGVPLPARRPPINASTSGLHHFDHRLLVDTVQREREMRERDIMMRAVSEQQGARMAMYEEEMAGEEDERGWSSPTGYHPRHRGSISAADREAYYDGRRGSQRRPPAQADDEWAYALGQTFVPRTPFPPTSGRMPPGFGSPQTPNSPTRTYSQGPRPNTVPRSGAGGYGGGGGGLRLNMGGQYSGGRYAAMTPPRPGAVQSPQSARTPFSANAQSFSASTPIGTHPPLGAYYSYDGAAEQETPSLSAIQAPAAAPPSDEHPQAVEPARYGDGEPGAPRDDAGAEGQIEGTFAKNGDREFSPCPAT